MFWTLWLSTAVATPPPGIVALDLVQPVQISAPFTYEWNALRPETGTATIIVVEISPGTATMRQTAGPVLYVGQTPAARVHPGETDHHLVVFVPGLPDLTATPIFWGPETLPERVTEEIGAQAAQTADGLPFSREAVQTVTQPLIQGNELAEMFSAKAVP